MTVTTEFQHQLTASADTFEWGVRQVPAARQDAQPPSGLGEWSALRQVFHMLYYEREFALPSMQQWLGRPKFSVDNLDEDAAWAAKREREAEALLAGFSAVRTQELALLARLEEGAWSEVRQAIWGPVTLHWVVGKTPQHTAEHTNSVLRLALFWNFYLTHKQG